MKISTMGLLFGEALTSLRRNGWLALASATTVAITLMILGASLLMVININYLAGAVESEVEIAVFLNKDLTAQQVFDLGEVMKKEPGIREVKYVSKDDALVELRKNFQEKQGVLDMLGEKNPLPDKYRVKVDKPELVKSTAAKLKQLAGVEKVNYAQGVIEKLFPVTRWVRILGLVIVSLLAVAAVFLISTTIRLTVFSRRKEISIMKYLGATDWFIRWPFILEGIVLGLAGSLVAVVVLYFTYANLNDALLRSLPFLPLQRDMGVIGQVYQLIIVVGTALGAVGSMISVRRFLKV